MLKTSIVTVRFFFYSLTISELPVLKLRERKIGSYSLIASMHQYDESISLIPLTWYCLKFVGLCTKKSVDSSIVKGLD